MMELSDGERMILQRIMAAGAMDEHKVRSIAKRLINREISKSDTSALIKKLATNIQPFALDLRQTVYDDGKMYVAVVNTSHDALTEFSSGYKAWEIVFLRKVIEAIVESEHGIVHESDLVNLRENTSISDIMELLHKLTSDQWLAPSLFDPTSHQLSCGPRVYLELIAFLRDLSIKQCQLCQGDMLQGFICCDLIVHQRCIQQYEEKGLRYKCTQCKQPISSKP